MCCSWLLQLFGQRRLEATRLAARVRGVQRKSATDQFLFSVSSKFLLPHMTCNFPLISTSLSTALPMFIALLSLTLVPHLEERSTSSIHSQPTQSRSHPPCVLGQEGRNPSSFSLCSGSHLFFSPPGLLRH